MKESIHLIGGLLGHVVIIYLNVSKSWICQMCDMKSSNCWMLMVLYSFNGWTQIVQLPTLRQIMQISFCLRAYVVFMIIKQHYIHNASQTLESIYGTMGTITMRSPLEGIYIQSHTHFWPHCYDPHSTICPNKVIHCYLSPSLLINQSEQFFICISLLRYCSFDVYWNKDTMFSLHPFVLNMW